jgi:hypothetical protein
VCVLLFCSESLLTRSKPFPPISFRCPQSNSAISAQLLLRTAAHRARANESQRTANVESTLLSASVHESAPAGLRCTYRRSYSRAVSRVTFGSMLRFVCSCSRFLCSTGTGSAACAQTIPTTA